MSRTSIENKEKVILGKGMNSGSCMLTVRSSQIAEKIGLGSLDRFGL